jgi:hypothetical protein
MINSLRNFCVLNTEFTVRKNCVTVICFGVKQVVLELRVSPICGLKMLASQRLVYEVVSNWPHKASWCPIFVPWFGHDHLFTWVSRSSVISNKTVHSLLHTAYYAYSVFLAVCQVLRDISCVNPSRTPKAFKGKGSAVSQCVKSGSIASSSVLAGAGA